MDTMPLAGPVYGAFVLLRERKVMVTEERRGLERTRQVSMLWRESSPGEGTMLRDRVRSCAKGRMERAKTSCGFVVGLTKGHRDRYWHVLRRWRGQGDCSPVRGGTQAPST